MGSDKHALIIGLGKRFMPLKLVDPELYAELAESANELALKNAVGEERRKAIEARTADEAFRNVTPMCLAVIGKDKDGNATYTLDENGFSEEILELLEKQEQSQFMIEVTRSPYGPNSGALNGVPVKFIGGVKHVGDEIMGRINCSSLKEYHDNTGVEVGDVVNVTYRFKGQLVPLVLPDEYESLANSVVSVVKRPVTNTKGDEPAELKELLYTKSARISDETMQERAGKLQTVIANENAQSEADLRKANAAKLSAEAAKLEAETEILRQENELTARALEHIDVKDKNLASALLMKRLGISLGGYSAPATPAPKPVVAQPKPEPVAAPVVEPVVAETEAETKP